MEIIGYIATVLTISAFLPQVYKVVATRQTRDLSLATYVTLATTGTLWTIYGIGINRPAIYITNVVVGICALVISALIIFDKKT